MSFSLSITTHRDRIRIVEPHGPIDHESYDFLERSILKLLGEGAGVIILDMSFVPRISSVGIGVLISCLTEIQEQKEGLLILMNPQNEVRKTLEVMESESIFRICGTLDEALRVVADPSGFSDDKS